MSNTKSLKENFIFDLLFFAVIAILILSSFFISPYINIIGFVLCSLYMLKFGIKRSSYFMFLLLPLASIFKLSPRSFSLLTILQLQFIIQCVFKYKSFPVNKNIMILLLIFVVDLLATTISGSSSIVALMGYFLAIVTFFYMFKNLDEDSEMQYGIRFCISSVVSAVFGYFASRIPGMNSYVLSGVNSITIENIESGKLMTRFYGLFGDANLQALYCIISIAVIFSLFYKNKVSFTSFLILFLPNLVFGLLTVSKTFVILFALIMVLYGYSFAKGKKFDKYFKLFFVLAWLALFAIAISSSARTMLFNYINRFSFDDSLEEGVLNQLTTNRYYIWDKYLTDFFTSYKFVFGNGLYGGISKSLASHNSFIQCLYMGGLVGCVCYFIIFASTIKYSMQRSETKFIGDFLPLVILLFLMMSLDLITFDGTYYILILALSSFIYKKKAVQYEKSFSVD